MDDLERKKYEQEFVEDVNKESEGNEGDSSSQEISPRRGGSTSPEILVDGKRVLQEYQVYDKLGYRFSSWKKWRIICVIFVCQLDELQW